MTVIPPKRDRSGKHIEAAERIGVRVVKSEDGDWRRQQIELLNTELIAPLATDSPQHALTSLETKFDKIHTMLRHAHIPWARGGSSADFAELLFLLEKLNGRVKAFFKRMHRIVQRQETAISIRMHEAHQRGSTIPSGIMNITWNTVHAATHLIYVDVFSRLLGIGNVCWSDADVNVNQVIALAMPMVMPGRTRDDITRDDLFGVPPGEG